MQGTGSTNYNSGSAYIEANDPCKYYDIPAGETYGRWRTPSQSELQVLDDTFYATVPGHSKFVKYITHKGYWIGSGLNNTSPAAGKESEYLFLPAAGGSDDNTSLGSGAVYWSTTPGSTAAYLLYFTSSDFSVGDYGYRNYGRSVRCVSDTK
jgi:uncharacterized protein (TIGR02145 family)